MQYRLDGIAPEAEGEEWWVAPTAVLIGKVRLEDGSLVSGFICEGAGLTDAEDITHLGSWRAWLASRAKD